MCNGGLDIGDLVVEQNETDDEEERRIARYGLIKRKFRLTNVSSLDDLASVVNESAACNLCQLVGTQDGTIYHRAFPRLGRVFLPFSPPGWYQEVLSLML